MSLMPEPWNELHQVYPLAMLPLLLMPPVRYPQYGREMVDVAILPVLPQQRVPNSQHGLKKVGLANMPVVARTHFRFFAMVALVAAQTKV